jgi:hypothetical protein
VAEIDDELLFATLFMISDLSADVARIRDLLEEELYGEDPENDG